MQDVAGEFSATVLTRGGIIGWEGKQRSDDQRDIFKTESIQSRDDAGFFEDTVAYHLKRGDAIPIGAKGDALVAGEGSVAPRPPARVAIEITVEQVKPPDDPGNRSLEFKLIWDENSGGGERGC